MKKKVRFIINPKSGTGGKENLTALINKHIDPVKFESEISFTKEAGHATVLAKEAVEKNYDIVVAVGGDGSVNETAKSLTNTSTSLGIIPTGSGNGLARHLGIPVDVVKSVELLNHGKPLSIDTLTVNEHFCAGTIGIGFDAHVAHLFAGAKKRGYSTYVKLVLAEFSTYEEKRFSILVDGTEYERDCFLLTFANSSQFGNNAVIAPFADVRDGIIEISIMKRFPAIVAPSLIYRLMKNTIHHSRYFESMRGKTIRVKNNNQLQGHIDGEPVMFTSDLAINIHPLSINVIVATGK
jgi:diacylglycerol kinase (ATP)